MQRWISYIGILAACGLAACAGERDTVGPRLVREVTVQASPDAALPTLMVTDTPVRRDELPAPLGNVTVAADYVLVTPTLPPSKTPTQTPTFTPTPTQTVTPSPTATSSATAFLLPTSVIVPINAPVAAPIAQICDTNWFFIQPRPASCPRAAPNASNGVYQTFQYGVMLWVGSQDAIYVLYADGQQPLWEAHRDTFDEGMSETSPEYDNAPGPNLWQPRRGFGTLWRANALIRGRIGWATIAFEQPYSVQVQTSNDSSLFISAPSNLVYNLLPNGIAWQSYSTAGGGGLPALPAISILPPLNVVTTPLPLPTALGN